MKLRLCLDFVPCKTFKPQYQSELRATVVVDIVIKVVELIKVEMLMDAVGMEVTADVVIEDA